MHLNLGLAKTINRATHVTRGFRRIVMVTAAGEGRPGRLVADLTNEFSRRGIDVSQLPIEGSEDTASSMPAPAHKVLAKWSRHRQGTARHELVESLDHQCALIVTDPRRLDEIVGLQAQSDRPVVVLLATDPDDAPDKLAEIVDVVVTLTPRPNLGNTSASRCIPSASRRLAAVRPLATAPTELPYLARAPMSSLPTLSSPSTTPAKLCPAGPWRSALTMNPEPARQWQPAATSVFTQLDPKTRL